MRNSTRSILTVLALGCLATALMAQHPATRTGEPRPGPFEARAGQAHNPGHRLAQSSTSGIGNPMRPAGMLPRETDDLFMPRATAQFATMPNPTTWANRDLMAELRAMARRGFIPVLRARDVPEFQGYSYVPSGWIAYGFLVPGKQKLHVRLYHPNTGWFRLMMVDKWGRQYMEGMTRNKIFTGNPEVSYDNPSKLAMAVYVIVDDPGWLSTPTDPFTLKVDRSWDPAATATQLPEVHGIWAKVEPSAKPAATPAPEPAPAPAPAG